MIKTLLQTSQYAQLTYVIPTSNFTVSSNADVAAVHILEHWLLEGSDVYMGAEAVFRTARELGGSVSATVSRKAFMVKLTYYAPYHDKAVAFMNDLVYKPRFNPASFDEQVADVMTELKHDDAVTLLFDQLYAGIFLGRYGLTGGGTIAGVKSLTLAAMQPFIDAFKRLRGQLFWAGPEAFKPQGVDDQQDMSFRQSLISEKVKQKPSEYVEDALNGLVVLDPNLVYLERLYRAQFIHEEFGWQTALRTHVLPTMIVTAISFDRPQLDRVDIMRAYDSYEQLDASSRDRIKRLVHAGILDEMSYEASASRIMIDRAINADYDRAIGIVLSP